MHTLLIWMSAFTESTNYLYGIWRYMAWLVICEKSEKYVEKTHWCWYVKLILIVKSKNTKQSVKMCSIEHFYQLKIEYNNTFGFNFISKLHLGVTLSNFVLGAPRFLLASLFWHLKFKSIIEYLSNISFVCLQTLEICYQMMKTEWQFWLNNVYKIFYADHIRHGVFKIEYSKSKCFGVLR